jgi:hypothetical protein
MIRDELNQEEEHEILEVMSYCCAIVVVEMNPDDIYLPVCAARLTPDAGITSIREYAGDGGRPTIDIQYVELRDIMAAIFYKGCGNRHSILATMAGLMRSMRTQVPHRSGEAHKRTPSATRQRARLNYVKATSPSGLLTDRHMLSNCAECLTKKRG